MLNRLSYGLTHFHQSSKLKNVMPDCEIGDGSLNNAISPNPRVPLFSNTKLFHHLVAFFSAEIPRDLTVFESHSLMPAIMLPL